MSGSSGLEAGLAAVLAEHKGEIAADWAARVQRMPGSRYQQRPLEELVASTERGVEGIIRALETGDYNGLEAYLADVSLTRLGMGFEIAEVIEALLLFEAAAFPLVQRAYPAGSREQAQAMQAIQGCARWIAGRFGSLYASQSSRQLLQEQRRTALMLEAARAASASLDLGEVLRRVARGMAEAVGVKNCGIYLLDPARGLLMPTQGRAAPEVLGPQVGANFMARPLDPRRDIFTRQVLESRQPAVCADAALDPRTDKELVRLLGLKSILAVPFVVKDRVLGVAMVSTFDHPHAFTQEEIELARGIANAVALAIENARLYQQEQERRGELQTLLDVAAASSSSLELDEMLRATLDRLVELVGASRAGIMLRQGEDGELIPYMLRPPQDVSSREMAEVRAVCEQVLADGRPLYVMDGEHPEPGALLPLRVHGEALGVLVIVGPAGKAFTPDQRALFEAIADQVAVAVERARLYAQAEETAAAAERSRLARELHDAVTQTLFSASLIAEVLPRLWERDRQEGERRLQELRELTRGALAEMRTLLHELRPGSLTEVPLPDLLRQLGEAVRGRARLAVEVIVEGECAFPPEVQVALYRIAQEALNNVAKHAAATRAQVRLCCSLEGKVLLEVEDDGRGFDPQRVSADHLGVRIMQERAASIGAQFAIRSQDGQGTRVSIRWHPTGG